MDDEIKRLAELEQAAVANTGGCPNQRYYGELFQIEHIVARSHGGSDEAENLALACRHCNLHKGPNLSGIDPESSEITRLFHPRRDEWHDHFDTRDGFVHGLTDI